MPQSISMIMLGVRSLETSVPFYRDIVQFTLSRQFSGLAFFEAGAVSLLLSEDLAKAIDPAAGAVEIILPAASVQSSVAELKSRGASFFRDPHEVTPGSFAATMKDPDGHMLTLFGPA